MAGVTDFSDLAALLQDQQEQYLLSNPYYLGAAGIAKAGNTAGYDMPAWQKLLAGAVAGLGGGFLKGVGERQAEEKSTALASAFAEALETPKDKRDEIYAQNPDLKKMSAQMEMVEKTRERELSDFFVKEKQKQLAAALYDPPKTRERMDGPNLIQEQLNPITREWTQYGAGPRFKATPDSVTINNDKNEVPEAARSIVVEQLAKTLGMETSDPRLSAVSSDFRLVNMLNKLDSSQDVTNRFDANKADKDAMAQVLGYEPVKPGVGKLTPEEARKFHEKLGTTAKLVAQVEQLGAGDLDAITGMEAAQQKALSAFMFESLRGYNGSGAAQSAQEVESSKAMMPLAAAGNLLGAFKAGALGQDQKQLSKFLAKVFQENADYELLAAGLRRSSRPLDTYPKTLLETYGLSTPTPTGGPAVPPPGGAPAASPTQTPPPSGPYGPKVTLKNGGTATWDGQGYRPD